MRIDWDEASAITANPPNDTWKMYCFVRRQSKKQCKLPDGTQVYSMCDSSDSVFHKRLTSASNFGTVREILGGGGGDKSITSTSLPDRYLSY